MKTIQLGITGGIGSGKSVVCRVLSVMGIPVYDADSEAKLILENNPEIVEKVRELFGEEAYTAQGNANRPFIASIVFKEPAKLNLLNKLIHPAVRNHYRNWVLEQNKVPLVVKEAAIMFESGSYEDMDFVAAVVAPEKIRMERVMKRDGKTVSQIQAIMAKQLSDEELIKRSDFTIMNDEKHLVTHQLLEILHQIQTS